MKVAVNTRFLLKGRLEGIGWYTHEIISRIVKNHPEIEFHFLFDRPYDKSFLFNSKNVIPHVISPSARHPFLWYAWFEIGVKRALKKICPDVFLSLDGYLCLTTTIPTIMACHDIAWKHYPGFVPWLVQKYYEYYVPKFLQRSDKLITVSDFVKNDLIENYSLPPDKIKTVYNGVKKVFK